MTGDDLIAHLQALPAEIRALRVAGYDNNPDDGGLVLFEPEHVRVEEATYIMKWHPIYYNVEVKLNPPERFLVI